MTLKKNYDGVIPDSFFIGLTTPIELKNNGGVLEVPHACIFNPDGEDLDFQIKGDNEDNLFFADAGNDKIGIHVATPIGYFSVQKVTVDDTTQMLYIEKVDTCGDDGFFSQDITLISARPKVAALKNNTGHVVGQKIQAYRRTDADQGELHSFSGQRILYGHTDPHATAKTLNSYGLYIKPYAMQGEIVSQYDIYCADTSTGGTLTNLYGIYILGADKKSQIFGTTKLGHADNYIEISNAGLIKPVGAGNYTSSDGSAGVTGSFLDQGGNTITVKNGLITNLGV